MEIKIFAAKKHDLKEIAKLNFMLAKHESKLDKLIIINKKAENAYKRYISAKFKSQGTKFFIALHNNKIIGYVFGEAQKWKGTHTTKLCKYVQIHDIFVMDKFRNKGVGKKLLDKIHEFYKNKGAKFSSIDVYTNNKSALKFYEKKRFENYTLRMIRRL